MEEFEKNNREEVFSRVVRAGKRTYFLDVKATKSEELFLTITESKKRFRNDGRFFYEKHKLFLYKEDFEKFTDSLNEALDFIKENQGDIISSKQTEREDEMEYDLHEVSSTADYMGISFDE